MSSAEKVLGPSRPRSDVRRFSWACLACAALLVVPVEASAGDVVVLRSSDRASYLALQVAFSEAAGPSVGLNLGDPTVALDVRKALRGATVVLAVGPDAAAAVVAAQPRAHVLLALAQQREKPGVDVIPFAPSPPVQIAAFKRALPSMRHVGLLYGSAHPRSAVVAYAAAAAEAGLVLHSQEVFSREEAVEEVRAMLRVVDGLWLVPDTTVVTPETFRIFVQASLAARVPLLGYSEGMARTGALVSVEASVEEVGRCAGLAARRVREGSAAGPYALKGRVFLNSAVASLLHVPLSPALRQDAAKVFE